MIITVRIVEIRKNLLIKDLSKKAEQYYDSMPLPSVVTDKNIEDF